VYLQVYPDNLENVTGFFTFLKGLRNLLDRSYVNKAGGIWQARGGTPFATFVLKQPQQPANHACT
jgi:hypothetical protein